MTTGAGARQHGRRGRRGRRGLRAAIVSVGTEVVVGDQVDTNAPWVATRLRTLGVQPVLTLAVGDGMEELVDALEVAAGRADVVIVGGGLGPTSDDRTRDAVAAFAGLQLQRRVDVVAMIEQRFAGFGRTMPPINARQADIPVGGVVMPPVGTAAGFTLQLDDTVLHVLPGVPWELRRMFDQHVAEQVLAASGGTVLVTRVVHVVGMGESDVAAALVDVEAAAMAAGLDVAYLATGRGIQVKVSGAGPDESSTTGLVGRWIKEVVAVLGPAAVGIDGDGIEAAVVAALRAAGLTIGTAESATGGMVAARLTQVPGASAVVRGGVVTYATDLKATLAGVDAALLDAYPPVSQPVTEAMAIGVRGRLGVDIGVATTASAGPTAQDGVPVGTAVWAVADANGSQVWSRHLPGDRDAVRERLATAAIDAVRRRLGEAVTDGSRG